MFSLCIYWLASIFVFQWWNLRKHNDESSPLFSKQYFLMRSLQNQVCALHSHTYTANIFTSSWQHWVMVNSSKRGQNLWIAERKSQWWFGQGMGVLYTLHTHSLKVLVKYSGSLQFAFLTNSNDAKYDFDRIFMLFHQIYIFQYIYLKKLFFLYIADFFESLFLLNQTTNHQTPPPVFVQLVILISFPV